MARVKKRDHGKKAHMQCGVVLGGQGGKEQEEETDHPVRKGDQKPRGSSKEFTLLKTNNPRSSEKQGKHNVKKRTGSKKGANKEKHRSQGKHSAECGYSNIC